MHRSDGTWCYVEAISNNQIENPAVGALVVNARDVSERRATEEELRRNVELLRRTDTERRSLLARVVHVQEEERRRLSGMIHDEPIQSLTAVGMRLQMLRGSVPEAEQPAVSNVENAVCEAIARLRDLMFELRPPILDRGGVVPAIRVYMDRLFGDADLHRTLEDRLEGDLDEDTRLLVYRIVQEALVNVKRHGQAEVLRVALDTKEGGVLVAVSDDGVGFDPDGLRDQAPMRVGVVGMRERAEMAGGWLTVESRPGRGSAVKFWLPGRTDR
jgi:signal transduction histidine kinase